MSQDEKSPSGLMWYNENKSPKQAMLNTAVTSCSCDESQCVAWAGGTAGGAGGGAGSSPWLKG